MNLNKLITFFSLGAMITFILLVMLLMGTAHCAVTSKPHDNSLGVLQYQENPNTYVEGAVMEASIIDKNAVVVRVQPRGTYGLYTEDIMFCPGAIPKLQGKANPMVLVYERTSHQLVGGLGCHNLKYVDEVRFTKELQ